MKSEIFSSLYNKIYYLHYLHYSGVVQWSDRLYPSVFHWVRKWRVPPVSTTKEGVAITGTN